ncbi:MAG: hypothetical protein PHZ25_04195, partial [Candidatus Pacebacteria bacterium]|nr:hypothetical protein [Candidatus Paceibacterota bacterium]
VGADDAEFLEKQFSPEFSKYDLLNLDNYQLLIKMMLNNKLASPFKLKTLAPTPGNIENGNFIKQLSSSRYGRPKAIVEAEIAKILNLS